jgi:hypothetical protein
MLEAVGHPVAVNPDSALAAVAQEQGWEVLRFDRLGRKLALGGALGAAAVGGGATATLLTRRTAERSAQARVAPRLRLPPAPRRRDR